MILWTLLFFVSGNVFKLFGLTKGREDVWRNGCAPPSSDGCTAKDRLPVSKDMAILLLSVNPKPESFSGREKNCPKILLSKHKARKEWGRGNGWERRH